MEPNLYDRNPLEMPEFFLIVAALLQMIVGGTFVASGNSQAVVTVFTGLIMASSALASLGYLRYRILKEVLSIRPVSFSFGAILLVNAIVSFASFGLLVWFAWVTMISAILSFYTTYLSLFHRII